MAKAPQQAQSPIGSYGNVSRMKVTPVPVVRSKRRLDMRVLTSLQAGYSVPLAAFGLLREDKLDMSRFRFNFEMLETVEVLMNAINVRVMAYLVPNLAFDRFNGIDALNRSYQKEPEIPAGPITPYFETMAFARATNAVLVKMGRHAREGQLVNTAYVEAYNKIWNFRAANRSPDLPQRAKLDTTLAKAFWQHQQFADIVPDFDQAVIDGEVPLNVTNAHLPVKGIAMGSTAGASVGANNLKETGTPGTVNYPYAYQSNGTGLWFKNTAAANNTGPQIFAELAENGITVSLSNIEMARKTQAFAALRKQYTGFSDDYIIDLLMNGITVPEQAWRQPILLADQKTIFGMSKRFSASADDLTASVVNGATFIDLAITTPQVPTGGVVMFVAEIAPEQLFERQQDPYLFVADQETLPEFLRDTLDPEKVEVVQNQYVDVAHATPTATFGYRPLNAHWNGLPPGIGGKFYRPTADAAFDEDRQRIWAVETLNPTLAADFYLCTNMHQKPFVVTTGDNFEIVARGVANISGNTVFGNLLIEASDDYNEVLEDVDQGRIQKPASTAADEPTQAEKDLAAADAKIAAVKPRQV